MMRYGPLVLLLLAGCTGGGKGAGDDATLVSYKDSDGDTIIDLDEGFVDPNGGSTDSGEPTESLDTDGDGTPDYLDTDSDNDGISDADEAGDDDPLTLPWDTDGDGIKDFRDLDSDGNCIADADEDTDDKDGDGFLPWVDLDDDGDGIKDTIEIGDACAMIDSDGDGKADFVDRDSDGDGVGDQYEAGTSSYEDEPRDTDHDGTPDYLDQDSDGDGFTDTDESGGGGPGTAPRDTDGDGIYDFADTDADGDGITDATEESEGLDPYDADTDGDGYTDGAEETAGTDPLDSSSVIEGLYVTVPERTTVEQDFEFTLSIQRGDIAFLLDTTCSMTATLSGVSGEFGRIVTALSSALPDAQYGVAHFDDYPYTGMGVQGADLPFELVQQITSNTSAVQSALSGLSLDNGGDGPESSMEGLYQGLTGAGYDQDCDGNFDRNTDVPPFLSSSSDPFSGHSSQAYDGTSEGTLGGFGFRDYALPIIVYATDNYMRDPESSNSYYNRAPRGCPQDAGNSDVSSAANDIGAKLIGIAVSDSLPNAQMNALARATNSMGDTDGDGHADDNLVFSWSGSSSTLRTTIVNAIEDAVSAIQFSSVSLVVDGDEHGFVSAIDPESYTLSDSASGQTVEFTLTFRGAVASLTEDQVFRVTLNVVGDGSVLLDTLDVYVLVPGSGS
jgi:hypothetical protein